MFMPTRRHVDPTASDVISEAIQQDRNVTLTSNNGSLAVEIDGQLFITGLPWETFEYPLTRIDLGRDERELADELLRARDRRKFEKRKAALATDHHAAAEGVEI